MVICALTLYEVVDASSELWGLVPPVVYDNQLIIFFIRSQGSCSDSNLVLYLVSVMAWMLLLLKPKVNPNPREVILVNQKADQCTWIQP